MLRHPGHIKLCVALTLTSLTFFTSSVVAQSQAIPSDSHAKDAAAEDLRANDLKNEIETLKAENAVVRELLRKMEEQQKALLEQFDRLQRRLDGVTTAVVQPSGEPPVAEP
jgi:cell division protein FtsB